MNCCQTTRTFKTPANAEKFLTGLLAGVGLTLADVRYLIMVSPDGRYAPAVMLHSAGQNAHLMLQFAFHGCTVLS